MDEGTYRFLLRMPTGLRDSLRSTAEASGRSLNAEIVARLEGSLAPPVTGSHRGARVTALAAAATLALSLLGGSAAGVAAGAAYVSLQGHDTGGAVVTAGWSELQQQLHESAPRS